MPYSQTWLEDSTVNRCVLVRASVYDVVAAQDIFVYMSTHGYLTGNADAMFLPIINKGFSFTEAISAQGGISISYGDIEIANANGEYDTWLDNTKYIWTNREIKIYYGDPSWSTTNLAQVYTDFELIYDGIISDIDVKQRTSVNLKIRDKMERLNTPLTESIVGTYGTWAGGQTNQDTIKPLVFGEVHNTQPLLIDPATLEYLVNDGALEQITEIRDNGIPIFTVPSLTAGATVTLTTGKFKLTYALLGQCTVSLQGVKNSINLLTGALVTGTYKNNIANIIALIVTQYGKALTKLTATDLDLLNLAAFETANPDAVGVYVSSKENILTICQNIASSKGAQLYFTRKGKLQLLQYGVPSTTTSVTITDNDILIDTLTVESRTDVIAATKVAYAQNYTVQTTLAEALPTQHKDLFAEPWLFKVIKDTAIQTLHKLNADPDAKETLLITEASATAEATRLNNLYKITKTVYTFTGTARLLSLQLGQPVVLSHSRYGLAAGKSGQVVSLTPQWLEGTVTVGVLI